MRVLSLHESVRNPKLLNHSISITCHLATHTIFITKTKNDVSDITWSPYSHWKWVLCLIYESLIMNPLMLCLQRRLVRPCVPECEKHPTLLKNLHFNSGTRDKSQYDDANEVSYRRRAKGKKRESIPRVGN